MNRDVRIDFVDKKVVAFDIIVIVIVLLCVLLCACVVCLCARLPEWKVAHFGG